MIQLNISDRDAKTLLKVLSSAAEFYPQHAVQTRDQDTGRQIKKMAKKLTNLINQTNQQ